MRPNLDSYHAIWLQGGPGGGGGRGCVDGGVSGIFPEETLYDFFGYREHSYANYSFFIADIYMENAQQLIGATHRQICTSDYHGDLSSLVCKLYLVASIWLF
jgi:hypothetical protein